MRYECDYIHNDKSRQAEFVFRLTYWYDGTKPPEILMTECRSATFNLPEFADQRLGTPYVRVYLPESRQVFTDWFNRLWNGDPELSLALQDAMSTAMLETDRTNRKVQTNAPT